MILSPIMAEARARSILSDAWVMRESLQFSLPPSALGFEPGDTLSIDLGTGPRFYRLTDIVDEGARTVSAVRVSSAVYDAPLGPLTFKTPQTLPVFGALSWELMDLPLFDETADGAAPWFAAYGTPWPGRAALYRGAIEQSAASPVFVGEALSPAIMGRLESALPAGFSGRWDRRSFRVRLLSGALQSVSDEALFAGANAMAVLAADGRYEILQFRDATLQSDGTWVLSNLLRGQAGSEAQAGAGAVIGARLVLLNGLSIQPAFSADLRETAFTWSAGPAGEAVESENFTSADLTMGARGLMPLSPVHLKARADGAGGYLLSWIRRTRIGGDPWAGEVPLSEAMERYQVTIYDGAGYEGAGVVRVAETTSPSFDYGPSAVMADFGPSGPSGSVGGSLSGLSFGVRQWSDRVGWGEEGKLS